MLHPNQPSGTILKEAPMTITLELPPEAEANLVAQAKARGLSLDAFVKTVISNQAAAAASVKPLETLPLQGEELDRAFEEMADMVPNGTPVLSDEALSRESIYSREDEWNKNSR
jgi:hypothetical protein